MKTARIPVILLLAALIAVGVSPAPAAPKKKPPTALAQGHLSALVLMQRWLAATYRFLPLANPGPPISDTGFPPEPDGNGNFVRTIVDTDGTKIVITNHGGSAFDFDIDTFYPNGRHEHLEARPGPDLLNGVPTQVIFECTFNNGDHVSYIQHLQQQATFDFGLNFLYAVIWQGTVTLKSGECFHFELKKTKSFDCFNFFTGEFLPEEICEEWFDKLEIEPGFFIEVPKPERLHVDLGCGQEGTLDLSFPVLEPDVLDFGQNATGKFVLGGQEADIALIPGPEPPGWSFWETRGPGFEGIFELNPNFAGKGTVFKTQGGAGLAAQGKKNKRKLEFSARWNERGIGTIVFGTGQTAPAGPFAGALDFQSMKWSGLGAKFGPAPGL